MIPFYYVGQLGPLVIAVVPIALVFSFLVSTSVGQAVLPPDRRPFGSRVEYFTPLLVARVLQRTVPAPLFSSRAADLIPGRFLHLLVALYRNRHGCWAYDRLGF